MRVADIINQKLTKSLLPTSLEIVDDSHKHAGHAGASLEGESHFSVTIVSEAFVGKSRIQRQRLVYQALSKEMSECVHALVLQTLTPDEESKS
jgi:BolA protein